jgi:predicted permease
MAARLRSLLRGLLFRGALEQELTSELRFHVETRADELERQGLPRDEALRRARLELGSLETHKEDYRAARGLRLFDELRQDLLYALRSFRRNPGFTAVAVITLALGIGANTAMFSLVRGVLLRALPYPDAERLVTANVSLPDFEDLRRSATAFDGAAVWGSNLYLLGGEGPAEQIRGAVVSEDFFALLGGALLGRALGPTDLRDKVVVLGHGLWTRRFGADPRVLGRSVRISGELYSVVGVMPPEFQYPSGQFDLWVPMGPALDAAAGQAKNRGLRIFRAVLRLAPGVGLPQAQAEADAIAKRLEAEHRDTNEGVRLALAPIYDRLVGGVRRALLVLMGVVALVLLIASANVANLLLARAKTREREIAVRTALGASRARIARQLLTESLFLSGAGSALGVLLAHGLLRLLPAFAAGQIPRLSSARVDLGVLGFTAAVAVATGLLFGLAPAWQASRLDGMRGLREAGRGNAGGRSARRVRAGLTAAEVALALVVLVGAGLLVQSLMRLLRAPSGFVADKLLTFNVQFLGPRTPEKRAQLAAEVVARVSRLPGVVAAGGATALPPLTAQRATGFEAEAAKEDSLEARRAYFIGVLPGYFRALGTPLREGREVAESDAAGTPEVIVINRSLARRLYGSESALGRRIRLVNPEYGGGWRTVVGVVDDVRYSGLDDPGEAALYTPFAQTPFLWSYVMVRSAGPPMALAASVREAVRGVDPGLEAAAVKPMSDVVSETVAQPRFNVLLLSAFALLALLLAAVGIYGVVSYSVVQRTREIGVRVALGASRGDVLRLVTGEGVRMAGLGVVLGLLGAAAATRLLTALLFEVRPIDAPTFLGAALFLVLIAAAASLLPAWRATRVAPVTALHTE